MGSGKFLEPGFELKTPVAHIAVCWRAAHPAISDDKKDVLERQSLSEVKLGRGSPICERLHQIFLEYFKNNIPQREIAKALQISSYTVHNVIKIFRETGKIYVRKGQDWRSSRGFRDLRKHCITHGHDSVIDITK